MRYFIEAYRNDGTQILGTGSGQNVILDAVRPTATAAWRSILARQTRDPWKGATQWRLVTDAGAIVAKHFVRCAACQNLGQQYGCECCGRRWNDCK